MKMFYRYLIPIIVGLIIALSPIPEGIDSKAWNLLSIFVATITAMVTRPLPMGGIALVSFSLCLVTGTMEEKALFTGFSKSVVWLVVLIFFVTRSFVKSGLGQRIAYMLISKIGGSTLGIAYSLVFTELVIAPFIPSIATRAGGIIFPILRSITESFPDLSDQSENPDKTKNLGGFLVLTSYHANYITGSLFLTAMASNPMIQEFAAAQNINITWMNWAVAASVPGLISLILIPLFIYKYFPPGMKILPNANKIAKEKLAELGDITYKEVILITVFVMMLLLWLFGHNINVSITATALFGVTILILTNIILIEDILKEKEAWHTFIWFSILIMLSEHLQIYGLVSWFSNMLDTYISGSSWEISLLLIIVIYFYSHYFFASITTHVTTMYPALLALSVKLGAPGLFSALILAFVSNLYACLTHYGSTTAVIFSSARLVAINSWWKVGIISSFIHFLIWGGVGFFWWKFLGYF